LHSYIPPPQPIADAAKDRHYIGTLLLWDHLPATALRFHAKRLCRGLAGPECWDGFYLRVFGSARRFHALFGKTLHFSQNTLVTLGPGC